MSRKKGQAAEAFVEKALHEKGYQTLCKNFYCRAGEIDLIMKKNDLISFVEVRARQQEQFGSGSETVTASKQKKIIITAKTFIHQHSKYQNFMFSFDVADVTMHPDDTMMPHGNANKQSIFTLNWIPDAFDLGDTFSAL